MSKGSNKSGGSGGSKKNIGKSSPSDFSKGINEGKRTTTITNTAPPPPPQRPSSGKNNDKG